MTLTFLLAFSLFALGAAALIVANVVSGAVLTSRRDIGIVKALGFTPGQAVATFVGQMLLSALIGCIIEVPLGALGGYPLVSSSDDALGLPPPSGFDPLPLVLATVSGLLVVAIAAALPALRAGLLRPVEAIAPNAPSGLTRSVTLGTGDAFARPVRGLLTTVAVIISVATLAFAFGLHATLQKISDVRAFGTAADVTVSRFGSYPDSTLMQTLNAQPETKQIIAYDYAQLSLPQLSNPVTTLALRGDSASLGYPIESGRWYHGPGEAVGATGFVREAHLKIGDRFTASFGGRQITLLLVGEYFSVNNFGREMQIDWSSFLQVNPTAQPATYLVDLQAGANSAAFAQRIAATAPDYLSVATSVMGGAASIFNILNEVLTILVAILVAIAVAGVFNTLLLNTRERIRDTATLKALGMTPGQVISMVVASACVFGVVGGIIGIPCGVWLHQAILTLLGNSVGTGEPLPDQFTQGVYQPLTLPLLALVGIIVDHCGGAGCDVACVDGTAREPVARVLRAE